MLDKWIVVASIHESNKVFLQNFERRILSGSPGPLIEPD